MKWIHPFVPPCILTVLKIEYKTFVLGLKFTLHCQFQIS